MSSLQFMQDGHPEESDGSIGDFAMGVIRRLGEPFSISSGTDRTDAELLEEGTNDTLDALGSISDTASDVAGIASYLSLAVSSVAWLIGVAVIGLVVWVIWKILTNPETLGAVTGLVDAFVPG